MNFSVFIQNFKERMNLNSISEVYSVLGGEDILMMGLRQFQSIASGKQFPTPKLFLIIARHLRKEEVNECLLSFFESFCDPKLDKKFFDNLKDNLRNAIPEPQNNFWNDIADQVLYSEDQLKFLSENPNALRLHLKILLFDKISISELKNHPDILNELLKLNLVKIKEDFIESKSLKMVLPNAKNSPPSSQRKSTEFILATLNSLISYEGNQEQHLGCVTQMVKAEDAKLILEEIDRVKSWVKSLSEGDENKKRVPLSLITFSKILSKGDLQ